MIKNAFSSSLAMCLVLTACGKPTESVPAENNESNAATAVTDDPTNAPEYAACDARWDNVGSMAVAMAMAAKQRAMNSSPVADPLFQQNMVRFKTEVKDGACGLRYTGSGMVNGSSISTSGFCPLDNAMIEESQSPRGKEKVVVVFDKSCEEGA